MHLFSYIIFYFNFLYLHDSLRYDLFHTPAQFPHVFDKIRHNIEEKQMHESAEARIDIVSGTIEGWKRMRGREREGERERERERGEDKETLNKQYILASTHSGNAQWNSSSPWSARTRLNRSCFAMTTRVLGSRASPRRSKPNMKWYCSLHITPQISLSSQIVSRMTTS